MTGNDHDIIFNQIGFPTVNNVGITAATVSASSGWNIQGSIIFDGIEFYDAGHTNMRFESSLLAADATVTLTNGANGGITAPTIDPSITPSAVFGTGRLVILWSRLSALTGYSSPHFPF